MVAPSSRTSDGSVTFTIVTSMLMISAAEQSAARIKPLRERRSVRCMLITSPRPTGTSPGPETNL